MDQLRSLTLFTRVAELESFTAAARSLGVPKATASIAVQQLETRLGARLFHRTTRRVRLTQDGEQFYERCKDLLSDAEELGTMFQKTDQALSGRIRVDMSTPMARTRVIPLLGGFLDSHPGVEVELGSTDRAVDLVREGYDCVVRVGPVSDSGLVARKLGELELVNCASPRYLRRYGTPRTLDDLKKHQVVHYVGTLGQKPPGWEYFHDGGWHELPMRGRVTVNNAEAFMAACLAGLGLVQAPRNEHLKTGRLVEVLPRYRAQPMPVTLLYPHRRQLSRRVRAFMDWLAEALSSNKTRDERR